MNILFLMDPLEGVNPEKDSSLLLMVGAQNRHHRVFYLPKGGISYFHDQFKFRVTEVLPRLNAAKPFMQKKSLILSEKEVDAIIVRTDPPFDQDYLNHTFLLDRLPNRIPIWNSPKGLRTVNEKIWATQFLDLIPKTVVTRHQDDFLTFLEHEKKIIIKPTDGFGGSKIFMVSAEDPNRNVIYETVSENGSKEIIAQTYIPEAKEGDKRVILLEGNPLGAILRKHGNDDHRNNFFAGGKALKTTLTKRDLEIIKALKPKLIELGLPFVGIDIIGDYLIEVNVTSPTCLQEMNKCYHQNLEDQVIAALEREFKAKNPERKKSK